MKIGFVGLGKMGSAMARNLLRAGHEVVVFNRTRGRAEALIGDGAQVANTAAEAARGTEAVFSMLADDAAVEEATLGANGLASGLRPGAAHISSSTISVALGKRLAGEHAKREQRYIGAPVFGRPEAAEGAKLIIVAAGDEKSVEELLPLFDAMGRRTFYAGPEAWHGHAMKLCGNFMIAAMLETFGEAFTSLRKAGLDHHRFLEIMIELWQSPIYKNYGTLVADGKFDPAGFELKLGLKDIRLAAEFAEGIQAPMPLVSLLRDHLLSAMANGQEMLDWSSIERVLARGAGLG